MKSQEAQEALEEILFRSKSSMLDKMMCAQALLKIKAKIDANHLEKEIYEQIAGSKQPEAKLLRRLLLFAPSDMLAGSLLSKIKDAVYKFNPLDKRLTLTALELAQQNETYIFDELDILTDYIDTSDYPDVEPVPEIIWSS